MVEILIALAWLGHACIWAAVLNNLYGRPLPKSFLKLWRLFTGGVIAAFPLLLLDPSSPFAYAYGRVCVAVGGVLFPLITAWRLLRPRAKAVLDERVTTLDLWREHGAALVGDGKWAWCPRLPLNCVFRVDFTELTLELPDLPPEWDGLTIHLLSDLHFHGTPSRLFFDRVIGEMQTRWGTPDVVVLAGDYVDTDRHHEWVVPLLGRLRSTGPKLAILGNHDHHHHPEKLRAELTAAGFEVLGNGWREVLIRGVGCVAVGHEGPWFAPPPDLRGAPTGLFRLCVSHTPDNTYWGRANGVGLMLCGHVHGGQVRVPVIGSIFVPSVYGRRFDCGVFEGGGLVTVVSRGLSGKEPLRFRCHPEVTRLTLRAKG